jgi:nanoRNase/pAp phosphatase (c-di-AMP/oligoRNAs hydrolase)
MSKVTKFNEIISKINHKHVFIQTHNFPDPDAIASAYGLQYLLNQKGIKSTICYKGKIERSSAAKMVKLLHIDIVELQDMREMEENAEIILVDSQKGNANTIELPGSEIICIDHHPTFEKANYEFSDIRPTVGACASIIAEYFFKNDISMNTNVATALMYGIKIDTANMTRGVTDLDLDMFYKIYKMSDKNLIAELDTSVMHVEDLKAYVNAIGSIKIVKRMCFANTGMNSPEALIATISDFVLSLDEVDFAIVYSLKGDGIKLSVRSYGNADAGKITNDALMNIGNGGGHENMAGGFVPYPNQGADGYMLSGIQDKLIHTIEDRFMEAMENEENYS